MMFSVERFDINALKSLKKNSETNYSDHIRFYEKMIIIVTGICAVLFWRLNMTFSFITYILK